MEFNANNLARGDEAVDHRKRGFYYWYALLLSRYPVVVCLATVLVSAVCIAIVISLHGLPDFTDPLQGFESSQTPIHSRLIALENYFSSDLLRDEPKNYRHFDDAYSGNSTERQQGQIETARNSDESTNCDMVNLGDYAKMVFEPSGGNWLFLRNGIQGMCEIERKTIRAHPKFSTSCSRCGPSSTTGNCPPSWSLGTYVALLHNRSSCAEITGVDSFFTRQLLQRCASHYNNGTLCENPPCGLSEQAPQECFQFNAVYTIFNFLAPPNFAMKIKTNVNAELESVVHILPIKLDAYELVSIYNENFYKKTYQTKHVILKALDFGIETKFELFNTYLVWDVVYVAIGLVCVIVVMLIYTGSLLITLGACFKIVLSFLLSYFFYLFVFRREFFPFVNVVSIVLLIGLGAGDIFVYVDLWRQSLAQNKGADVHIIVRKTLHHATVTMLVTSVTTAGSLYSSIISNVTAVKCFGLFAGTAVIMNFILILTLVPATIVIHHNLKQKCHMCCPEKAKLLWKSYNAMVRLCYQNTVLTLVLKVHSLRYVWLFIFGALGIGGILVVYKYPGLQLPSSSEFQVLTDDNYIEQWGTKYKSRFLFYEQNQQYLNSIVLFGVKPIDNSDPWNPQRRGQLVSDISFDFSTKEHQEWMLQLCRRIRSQKLHNYDDTRKCFVELLIDYMDRPCVNASTGSALSPCCDQNQFPYDKNVLDICLRACSAAGVCSGVHYSSYDDTLSAVSIEFTSSRTVTHDYEIMHKYWNTANDWFEKQITELGPYSLKGGWFISYMYDEVDQLYIYDLQRSLGEDTPKYLWMTLAIVAMILLCTILNIPLAFYALLTIACAVFVTIGCMVLLRFELNMFESIIITLSVGLCVDFTVHNGVAYKVAPRKLETREDRTAFSIQGMGGAITAAALARFLAGVFLLSANVKAYFQFGLFLVLVTTISWTYATFFFQSLCAVFGPQRSCGDLTSLDCCNSASCCNGSFDVNEEDKGAIPFPHRNGTPFTHGAVAFHVNGSPPMQSFANTIFNDDIESTTESREPKIVRNPSHGKGNNGRSSGRNRSGDGSRTADIRSPENELFAERRPSAIGLVDLPEESVFSGVSDWLSANETIAGSNPTGSRQSIQTLSNPPQMNGFHNSMVASHASVRAVRNPSHSNISSNWHFKPRAQNIDLKPTPGGRKYRVPQQF